MCLLNSGFPLMFIRHQCLALTNKWFIFSFLTACHVILLYEFLLFCYFGASLTTDSEALAAVLLFILTRDH